jgi:large subunit ribosomal protein L20
MRVKKGFAKHQKHNKVHKLTKGYRMTKSNLIKVAKESILHAGQYSYNGRKKKKNDMKTLWIIRINAALHEKDLSYSKFQKLLKDKNIQLNRKVLSHFASEQKEVFDKIVDSIK